MLWVITDYSFFFSHKKQGIPRQVTLLCRSLKEAVRSRRRWKIHNASAGESEFKRLWVLLFPIFSPSSESLNTLGAARKYILNFLNFGLSKIFTLSSVCSLLTWKFYPLSIIVYFIVDSPRSRNRRREISPRAYFIPVFRTGAKFPTGVKFAFLNIILTRIQKKQIHYHIPNAMIPPEEKTNYFHPRVRCTYMRKRIQPSRGVHPWASFTTRTCNINCEINCEINYNRQGTKLSGQQCTQT